MGDRWKEVWNTKGADFKAIDREQDEFACYRELKKLDGFDVSIENAETYYRRFYETAINMWKYIQEKTDFRSAYEVGCGSGANLYLLKNRGVKVGGIDYSKPLSDIAGKVLKDEDSVQMGEAVFMTVDEKYDMVFSDSVFAYFPDETYGLKVLEKMYEKAIRVVVLSEVFDKAMKKECENYRREKLADYDELYQGLDKVFYDRGMFERFAKEHQCRIEFTEVDNEYYWNSRYLYNCYIFKA